MGQVRVLVADDNETFVKALRAVLADAPVEIVDVAPDGEAAMQLAVSLAPDIVLMDVEMPLLDGIGATLRLRTIGFAAPVIVLTAYDDEAMRKRARDAGADAYVTKEKIASRPRRRDRAARQRARAAVRPRGGFDAPLRYH